MEYYMILIIKTKEGWPCVLPKKILSEGKTYDFKEDLPDDEVFQDRFFGLWETASKNAKAQSLASVGQA
jgi:hypothetical protein